MIFHEFEEGVADMDIKSDHLMGADIYGLKLVSWFGANADMVFLNWLGQLCFPMVQQVHQKRF